MQYVFHFSHFTFLVTIWVRELRLDWGGVGCTNRVGGLFVRLWYINEFKTVSWAQIVLNFHFLNFICKTILISRPRRGVHGSAGYEIVNSLCIACHETPQDRWVGHELHHGARIQVNLCVPPRVTSCQGCVRQGVRQRGATRTHTWKPRITLVWRLYNVPYKVVALVRWAYNVHTYTYTCVYLSVHVRMCVCGDSPGIQRTRCARLRAEIWPCPNTALLFSVRSA